MKDNFFKKIKYFFVFALVVLVAGMALLGVLGFNQPVDYSNNYELHISVDQSTKNEKEVIFEYADKAFDELGINPISYGTQVLDDGSVVIYKFSSDVSQYVDVVLDTVQNGLNEKGEVSGVIAEVKAYETIGSSLGSFGFVALALGITVVAAFVVMLILNKLIQALALAFSTVFAAILFVAFTALVRVPAGPFIGFSIALASIFATIISIFILGRYKELRKDPDFEREDASVIATTIFNKDAKKIIISLFFVIIAVVSMIAVIVPYMMFVAAQLGIAIFIGTICAAIGTPFIYSLLGKKK